MEKYIVLELESVGSLAVEVNKKIAEGYTPIGGVAIQQVGHHWYYMQALFLGHA
jgi:hypothetical protein